MNIVYLHGFNSAYDCAEPKIKQLEVLGPVAGITYNTYGSYSEVRDFLRYRIDTEANTILVGTCLGGYWAAEMARILNVPSVTFNPIYDPHFTLQRYEGVLIHNTKINSDNILSESVIDSYDKKQLQRDPDLYRHKPLIFLDQGDEVVHSFQAQQDLRDFEICVFAGGTHQFTHTEQSLDFIQQYLEKTVDCSSKAA